MPHCLKCHRPMKAPTPDGLGPKCRKSAAPLPVYERDLLGYSPETAASVAIEHLRVYIDILALDARMEIRHEFAAARRRMGGWA